MHAADRPGTHHDDVVRRAHTDEFLSVQHAGQRFGQRRLGEADTVGDPVQARHGEDLGGHHDVLSEPAIVVVAHRLEVLAHP
jgi:hypothetical protein